MLVIAVSYFGFIPKETVVELKAEEVEKKVYQLNEKIPESEIVAMIEKHATGTKAYQMKRTIWCESHYYNTQSNVVKNGIREDSWGLSQIHLPSHPEITREETLDPEFAIKYMSDNFLTDRWYGYIKATDSCNAVY